MLTGTKRFGISLFATTIITLVSSISAAQVADEGFGTCTVRDSSVVAPIPPAALGESIIGPGYSQKTVVDTIDVEVALAACTEEIFTELMGAYCERTDNSGVATWSAITYSIFYEPDQSLCAASGCHIRSCEDFENPPPPPPPPPPTATPDQLLKEGLAMIKALPIKNLHKLTITIELYLSLKYLGQGKTQAVCAILKWTQAEIAYMIKREKVPAAALAGFSAKIAAARSSVGCQ